MVFKKRVTTHNWSLTIVLESPWPCAEVWARSNWEGPQRVLTQGPCPKGFICHLRPHSPVPKLASSVLALLHWGSAVRGALGALDPEAGGGSSPHSPTQPGVSG